MERIDDGFKTLVTFSDYPNIKLYEKEVTPPGITGGGANDTSTMRNSVWRTRAPKKLKTLSDASFTAAYDPAVYSDCVAAINQNQLITVTFPDTSSIAFWGWLDEFTPGRVVEGEQPTAEIKIVCSNQNNSGVETAPVVA